MVGKKDTAQSCRLKKNAEITLASGNFWTFPGPGKDTSSKAVVQKKTGRF
jgi:hypothetical protein